MSQVGEEQSNQGTAKPKEKLKKKKRKSAAMGVGAKIDKARKVKQALGDGSNKDEAKKVKQARKELKKSVDATICILEAILDNPRHLDRGCLFSRLKPKLHDICARGRDFGFVDKTCAFTTTALTEGFVASFVQGKHVSQQSLTLEIYGSERSGRLYGKYSAARKFQDTVRVMLTDIERKRFILGFVSTQAMSQADMYRTGTVIAISEYDRIPHLVADEEEDEWSVAILIKKATFVRSTDVIVDNLEPALMTSKEDYQADYQNEQAESSTASNSDSVATGTLEYSRCHVPQLLATQKLDMSVDDNIGCEGNCSTHGIWFPDCVLKCVKWPQIPDIQMNCYFAEKSADNMTNKEKRNILYWWTAVNVYSIRGKGLRKELPSCVVTYVRNRFPEDDESKYTGFRIAGNDSS